MSSPSPSPQDIRRYGECVCFNLRWFTRLVTQHYERRLRSSGLRFTQTPILARLAAGPAKMAELSDWLALERTALLRTLQPLLDGGYVRRQPAARGRGVELTVTAAGRRRLAELQPEWEEVQAEVVAAIGGPARWRDFAAAMETAATRLARN
jgi:DNA-binding MarR family transcriptional regulator